MKPKQPIESLIFNRRGQKVILDADLAALYGVPTKVFNQAVKRNVDRFPEDFAFQTTAAEFAELRALNSSQFAMSSPDERALPNWSQFVTSSKKHRGAAYRPWAFTEHGALMAANILRSRQAVEMSVFVISARLSAPVSNSRPTPPSSSGWRKLTRPCSNTTRHCAPSGTNCNRSSRRHRHRPNAASVSTATKNKFSACPP